MVKWLKNNVCERKRKVITQCEGVLWGNDMTSEAIGTCTFSFQLSPMLLLT